MKNLEHEGIYNAWIQTFMKSAYADLKEIDSYDIAFIWIPADYWASYRKWTSLAPKYVRQYSYWDGILWTKHYNLDEDILIHSSQYNICDLWDIHIMPTDLKWTTDRIESTIWLIASSNRALPLIIWWDHSIAYHTIKWTLNALNLTGSKDVAILHFDAHTDVERDYIDMPRIYHGSPFRYLIEDGIILPENLFTVGPRWVIPYDLIEFIKNNGINLFTMKHINDKGISLFFDTLIKKLETFKYIYITFDIDSIDPTEVKWTGTPLEGGFHVIDILSFFRKTKKLNIIGFELVELAPELDLSWYSNMVACNILWHFLSFWYKQKLLNL